MALLGPNFTSLVERMKKDSTQKSPTPLWAYLYWWPELELNQLRADF